MLHYYLKGIASGQVVPPDGVLRAIAINTMDGKLGWASRRVLMKCYTLQLPTMDDVLADLHEEVSLGGAFSFNHCKSYGPTADGCWGLGDIVVDGYAYRNKTENRVVCGTVMDNGSGRFATKLSFSSAFPELPPNDNRVEKFQREIRLLAMYKALTMLDEDMFRVYRPQDNDELTRDVIRQVAIYFFTINAMDRLKRLLFLHGQFFKNHPGIPEGDDIIQYLQIPQFLARPCNAVYWCRPTTALVIASRSSNLQHAEKYNEIRRRTTELYWEAVSNGADDPACSSKDCRQFDFCVCSTLPTAYVTEDFYKSIQSFLVSLSRKMKTKSMRS